MHIYLVGGAVRDQLLGLTVHEKDWVVVGSTAEEMLSLGYRPVGKDFPVFLHPETNEEYALARTERKVSKGYRGFTFHAEPTVTLIEDLKRRDLTINAMAQDENGQVIDPYGGQVDLRNKCFRHVSEAFREDPVRILRLARFATRFAGFKTDPATLTLMQQMVQLGEVDALVPERVWKETERALMNTDPTQFFGQLQAAGALDRLFDQPADLAANQQALKRASDITTSPTVRWAAWNASRSEPDLTALIKRYRLPKPYRELCRQVITYKTAYLEQSKTPNPTELQALLIKIGALRHAENLLAFQQCVTACESDALIPWNEAIQTLAGELRAIDTHPIQEKGLIGRDFAQALCDIQCQIITRWITSLL